MVNGALSPEPVDAIAIERAGPCRRPIFMTGPGQQTTVTTPAAPSVRACLLTCAAVCLILLSIAAFEMPMGDLPGLVLFPVLPLTAFSFVGCCFWSVFQLTRIRRYGVSFAFPLIVCALTFSALVYVPFTQLWLEGNFRLYLANRERIVARVEAGELAPNVAYNANLIALDEHQPAVSAGNDIVVEKSDEGTYVLFLTSRGLKHYFSGFLHVPSGGDPAKFYEFDDQPPKQSVRYGKDWYFVAN